MGYCNPALHAQTPSNDMSSILSLAGFWISALFKSSHESLPLYPNELSKLQFKTLSII